MEWTEKQFKNYIRMKIKEFWNDKVPMDQLRVKHETFLDVVTNGQFAFIDGVPWILMRKGLEGDVFYDTLHHEMVHFYLYSKGCEYDDTSKKFIEECLRLDIPLSGADDAQVAYRRYREGTELCHLSVEHKMGVIHVAVAEGYVYSIRLLYQSDGNIVPYLGDKGEIHCLIRKPGNNEDKFSGVGKTIENAIYLAWEEWREYKNQKGNEDKEAC